MRVKAIFSLDQRQQATTALTVHHQVDLPIADPSLFVDGGGSVIDRHAVGNRAFIEGGRPRTTWWKAMPQVLIQSPTGLEVGPNMLIDTLMGNRNTMGAAPPMGNLLRAPLMAPFALDQTTTPTRPFERRTYLNSSVLRAPVGRLSKVAVGAPVAS